LQLLILKLDEKEEVLQERYTGKNEQVGQECEVIGHLLEKKVELLLVLEKM
jgi:hypothetical protein